MAKQNMIETQIPFSGFYYSIHDSELDSELEYSINVFAEETGRDIPQDLFDGMQDAIKWGHVHQDYAREYVEHFLHEFMIEGEFSGMESPRFYNYSTDRVFAKITRASVASMWRKINKRLFAENCEKHFTSRDGFASSYNADWKTWGRISQWDHNQIYMIVLTYAEHESIMGSFDEYSIVESMNCGGHIANAIHGNIDESGRDYWAIYYYLIERAQRVAAA